MPKVLVIDAQGHSCNAISFGVFRQVSAEEDHITRWMLAAEFPQNIQNRDFAGSSRTRRRNRRELRFPRLLSRPKIINNLASLFLVSCKAGWCKAGLSKQGDGSYVVHAWCTLRSYVLFPWSSGWVYIAINDRHCYSMSLVYSWNEVGTKLEWSWWCPMSSFFKPLLHAPLLALVGLRTQTQNAAFF